MTHASDAADRLHAAVERLYAPLHAAAVAYSQAHSAARAATDIEAVMARTIDLILAAEKLAADAEEAKNALRSALADAIDDTGAPSAQTAGHTAYLSKKPAFVDIIDPALVPSSFWITPEPRIDTTKIARALKAQALVPGCTLVQPNSRTLNIRAKKEQAA